jgi:hypothetical protein
MKRDLQWWVLCVVHNIIVHPLLPAAEVLDVLGFRRASDFVFWLHDNTVPDGGG